MNCFRAVGKGAHHSRLSIPARIELPDGTALTISFLVDTGSEVNLVRQGLVPNELLRRSEFPLNFFAANQGSLAGGLNELEATITMKGKDPD